jgi:flagella basal body P-ring formation protein FlgA
MILKAVRAIFAIICVPLGVCASAYSQTVITVHDVAEVDSSEVTLGDVATIAGVPAAEVQKLTRLAVTTAPKPGCSKEIDRDFILAKLHQQGYATAHILFSGAGTTLATRSSQSIDSDALTARLRAYIESQMPWETADTVITVQEPPDIAGLPTGKTSITFECDGDYRFVGETTFRTIILVDGKPCKTLYLRANVRPFGRVAVALREMGRGDPIRNTDFTMVRKDFAELGDGFFTNGEALCGLVAARPISAGSVISLHSVDRPIAITRGKMVTAEVAGRFFRITAVVKAMDNGKVGDVIRLTNVDSKKTLAGEVINENTVRVVN